MSDWTKAYSSIELLQFLKEDVEVAQPESRIDWSGSLEALDSLMERLEHLELVKRYINE
jgi:hypothetical protein